MRQTSYKSLLLKSSKTSQLIEQEIHLKEQPNLVDRYKTFYKKDPIFQDPLFYIDILFNFFRLKPLGEWKNLYNL